MGKTDDEVRVSCESINAMAKAGVKLDKTVIDPLWDVFAKFQLSKAQSERLYRALHEAIINVRDESYGDKAIAKLKGVRHPRQRRLAERPDQLVAADVDPAHQRDEVHEGHQAAHSGPPDADQGRPQRDDAHGPPQDGEGRRA